MAAVVALLAACEPTIKGSGVYYEESRTTGPFVGLHVEDGIAAYVTVGGERSVRVIGDSTVVPHISTSVEPEALGTTTPADVLRVKTTRDVVPVIPPAVIITVPSFTQLLVEDVKPVEVRNAAAAVLTVKAVGGARVTIARAPGHVGERIAVELHDAAQLDATEYVTSTASVAAFVEVSGTSTALLHSDGPVVGSASGDSTVNNLLGAGPCFVTTTGNARTVCN